MFNYKEWLEERENGGKRRLKWLEEHEKKIIEAEKESEKGNIKIGKFIKIDPKDDNSVPYEQDYDDYKDELLVKEGYNSRI